VITISRLRGRSTFRFFRLCVRAPRMRIWSIERVGKGNLLVYEISQCPRYCHDIPAEAGRMSSLELRASLSLASLFALRMLGLFLILPVFAVHAPAALGRR